MSLRFIPLIFLITLIGCSATATKINKLHQNFIKSFREPGEDRVSSPKSAYETYRCNKSLLYLESLEVIPNIVSPGKEINQRIRYAYCSPEFSKIVPGKITRTIFHKGQKQFEDLTDYSFKPGIWNVDAFIEIPAEVEEGNYSFEIKLQFGSEIIVKSRDFIIKK